MSLWSSWGCEFKRHICKCMRTLLSHYAVYITSSACVGLAWVKVVARYR
jgi:hypothetical protein